MNKVVVVAMLGVAVTLCACAGKPKPDPQQPAAVGDTYRPTGSHIRERRNGRRSPENSSSAPVQDLKDSPAVTVIQNQAPK